MTGNACLIFTLVVSGLAMTGNDCLVFTLEGRGLPHAVAAGWGGYSHCLCWTLQCLLDWVLKGHLFSSLPLAARGYGSAIWSSLVVDAKFGT